MTKKENIKNLFANKKTRNILIATGMTVGLVVVVAASSMKKKDVELPPDLRGVRQVPVEAVENRTLGEMDPAYKAKFDQVNIEKAKAAEDAGRSAFLTLGDDPVPIEPEPKKTPEVKPLGLNQSNAPRASGPSRKPSDGKIHPAIASLAAQLNANAEVKRMTVYHAFETPEAVSDETPLLAASAIADEASGVPAEIYYAGGTMAAATFVNKLDSYNPGPAIATIHSGSLAGGKLMGSATPGKNGVGIQVQFHSLALKDGRTYGIRAMGLTEGDLSSLLASDVDHKIFNRFVLRPVAYFAQGMAEAVLSTGAGTKLTGNDASGLLVQEQEPLDTKEQVRVGVGKMTEELVNELEKSEYLTPRTTVKPREVFGVMFLETVSNESLINLERK